MYVKAILAIPHSDGTQDTVRGHSIFTGRRDHIFCKISIVAGPGNL